VATRILIVGFGNDLAGDDGAGLEVARLLRRWEWPPGVRIEEGGSDSLRIPGLWRGESRVWLVDAILGGRPPGSLCRLGHQEILAVPQRHATVHGLSLPESLRWISLAYPTMASVRYELWGIEPRRVEFAAGLSPTVARAARSAAAALRRAVADLAPDAAGRSA
jgi:hydrogenase maturation protease